MFSLRKMLPLFGAVAVTLGLTASASAAPIDTFSSPNPAQLFNSGGPVLLGPTVLGGGVSRTLSISGGALGAQDTVLIGSNGAPGSPGTLSVSAQTATFATILNYTFTAPQNTTGNTLQLDFTFVDAGVSPTIPGTVSGLLEVITGTGTLLKDFTIPALNGLQSVNLGFTGFTGGSGNLSQTNGIRLTFNKTNDAGVDFVLTGNQGGVELIPPPPTVPEPATLATLGLMGLFGGYYTRRKLKAASVAQA